MTSVVKFPTVPLEKNTMRRFHELFAQMAAAGMTSEQQMELMEKTCKEMGLLKVNGVWELP
jgi:hypothetical protein